MNVNHGGPLLLAFHDNQQLSLAIKKLQEHQGQTAVEHVHVKSRCHWTGAISENKVAKLLKVLASCRLRTLDIDMPSTVVQNLSLSAVLHASKSSLTLMRVNCSLRLQVPETGDLFCQMEAFRQLSALEAVSLKIWATGVNVNSAEVQDALVDAIVNCPRLKSVSLNQQSQPLSNKTFCRLVSLPTLEHFTCSAMDHDGNNLASLCEHLQEKPQGVHMKSLKFTKLLVGDLDALTKMLEINTSLEHLALTLGQDQVSPLAKGLQSNQGLKRLEIRGSGLGDVIHTSFSRVMPHNYWLQELRYNGCDYHADPGISLYLLLNKAGRHYLMQEENVATREEWVETLAKYKSNTGLVFHLLQINPSLLKGMGLNLILASDDDDEATASSKNNLNDEDDSKEQVWEGSEQVRQQQQLETQQAQQQLASNPKNPETENGNQVFHKCTKQVHQLVAKRFKELRKEGHDAKEAMAMARAEHGMRLPPPPATAGQLSGTKRSIHMSE